MKVVLFLLLFVEKTTGLFGTYEEVQNASAHVKGGVYVKFNKKREAREWFNASLQLPRLDLFATEVHISARQYDVSQKRDYYAAVAIYFGPGDPRNFCLQANPCFSHQNLHLLLFEKMLSMLHTFPVRIISDCKNFVYGIGQNMRLLILLLNNKKTWE